MNLLSQTDRAFILRQLQLAPDSVLADAMLAFEAIRVKTIEVRKLAETPVVLGFDAAIPGTEKTVVADETPRRNLNPGVSSITKIGSNTKADILAAVADGRQPAAKFEEHCKLLWERGEIKFDGEEWWV